MAGLSTMGSISLGWALVAGRKRTPRPAAGITAFFIFFTVYNPPFFDLFKQKTTISPYAKKRP
jgi:hypothetical protein